MLNIEKTYREVGKPSNLLQIKNKKITEPTKIKLATDIYSTGDIEPIQNLI